MRGESPTHEANVKEFFERHAKGTPIITDQENAVAGSARDKEMCRAIWRRDKTISLHVEYGEVNVGRMIRDAGGRWNKQKKVWELAYKQVVALHLTDRIVDVDVQHNYHG